MKLTQCTKHNLLRTLPGKHTVVSSAALYDYLGDDRYQEFIEWNGERAGQCNRTVRKQVAKTLPGFHPDTVEEFLNL